MKAFYYPTFPEFEHNYWSNVISINHLFAFSESLNIKKCISRLCKSDCWHKDSKYLLVAERGARGRGCSWGWGGRWWPVDECESTSLYGGPESLPYGSAVASGM